MTMRLRFLSLLVLAALSAVTLRAQQPASGPWVMQVSGTSAALRGIHAVGGGVAWASGTDGTVLRTEDSGYMWQSCALPPGAGKLDFRGIWAWDANTAVVMSSGPGDLSQLYKTTDGCSHWTLLFTNPDKNGFWDSLYFWSVKYGAILGDPVDGRFVVLLTNDGGLHWRQDESADLGIGNKKLAAFAASNSAILQESGYQDGFGGFSTGGTDGPLVFLAWGDCTMTISQQSPEACKEARFSYYDRVKVPIVGGSDSTGVFSFAARGIHGVNGKPLGIQTGSVLMAVGGDYSKPSESSGTAAWSTDGGKTWTAASKPPHGYRSAVAWDADAKAWIAVGTNGSDISYDDGKTWAPLDDGNWNALSLPWVVGPKGRIAKLDEARLKKR